MLDKITPLIITFNEAQNLDSTLKRLEWAKSIVVIDSFSTDSTLQILNRYPQARVYQRNFDTFAGQCNFGLLQIPTEWVLSMDADYLVTSDLVAEFAGLRESENIDGYTVRFKYCVFGKPLRGTLYPPRTVLYRKSKAKYEDDGHAHHVEVAGPITRLSSFILHDDRKPLTRWTSSQSGYVIRELQKLRHTPASCLSLSDRIRLLRIAAPFLVVFYCLFVQRICFDGWYGLYYVYQRSIAETILALEIMNADRAESHPCIQREVALCNAAAEALSRRLTSEAATRLTLVERVRKTKIIAPLIAPLYFLILHMGILSGWAGWSIAFQKMLSESLLAIYLIQAENFHDEGVVE